MIPILISSTFKVADKVANLEKEVSSLIRSVAENTEKMENMTKIVAQKKREWKNYTKLNVKGKVESLGRRQQSRTTKIQLVNKFEARNAETRVLGRGRTLNMHKRYPK